MSIEKLYYVYRHIRPDKNEVFYIGIGGTNSYRFLNKIDRSKRWKNVYNKCNGDITCEVIIDGLTREQAVEKEKEFILLYGRMDLNTGTLVNMTSGGEGSPNTIVPKSTRDKQSAIRKGRVVKESTKIKQSESLMGHTVSEITRAKISSKLRGTTNSGFGRFVEMVKLNRGDDSPNFRGYIYQINANTNEVIGVFSGTGDAERNTGISQPYISAVINGRVKHAHGFKFERHATKDFYNNKIVNNEFI